ncbi:hypothetical protein ACQPWW_00810 [Micromonospora sp. CA-240977]|uniref:hypothetical protein n=1 Tax=Micromonospora sp. CA-240977 TaxID=3239957 RepID=UPI003D8B7D2F
MPGAPGVPEVGGVPGADPAVGAAGSAGGQLGCAGGAQPDAAADELPTPQPPGAGTAPESDG